MSTKTKRRQTKSFPVSHVKAVDLDAGTFEAIVAVFGNVDLHGDRIIAGAFADSLDRWKSSGDPIPVIFSHQWHDLNAYLGQADASDVREIEPGSEELPEAIRDNGGLFVKGSIDTEEPEGRKALKLLKNRVVREFSFAYDIEEEERGEDGRNELRALDLIELGPTLKGANPLTQLLGAKRAGQDFDEQLAKVAETLGTTSDELRKAFDDVEPSTSAETDTATKARASGVKAWVSPSGTIERFLEAVRAGLNAAALERYGDELYTVAVEGTFDDRVLFYVELWEEPLGGGSFYEAPYSVAGDEVELGEWQAVELELSVAPKAKARELLARDGVTGKAGARHSSADAGRIQSVHDLAADLGASCAEEEPEGASEEEPEGEDGTDPEGAASRDIPAPGVLRTSLEAELLDL